VIGERRFLGLYTNSAYRTSLLEIPLLRGKVKTVLDRSGFLPTSHDAKALLEILEPYPRDALFLFEADELFRITMGVLGLGERQRVRLFVWEDPLDRFVWCLVTIPRDRFNTENRKRIGRLLLEALGGTQLDWTLQLSESILVRVHYIVRCADGVPKEYDVGEIEARLARATRAWTDALREALISEHGEERGVALYRRYGEAFPTSYGRTGRPRPRLRTSAGSSSWASGVARSSASIVSRPTRPRPSAASSTAGRAYPCPRCCPRSSTWARA
jgi:glutamate dehydrogenase